MKQRNNFIKKYIAIMLMVVLCVTMLPMAEISAKETQKSSVNMIKKEVTAYSFSSMLSEKVDVYYNGTSDIPYFDMDYLMAFMKDFLITLNPSDLTFTSKMKGNKLTWTRTSDDLTFRVIFDFKKNTITFNDLNGFFRREKTSLVGAEYASGFQLLFDTENNCYNRYGKTNFTIDLNEYGIKLLKDKKKQYMPIQTFSDIFLSRIGLYALFNDESVIYSASCGLPEDLKEIYYSPEPETKSDEFAMFNYGELCLAFDYLYGLKETHDIDTFEDFFIDTGLASYIVLPDSAGTDVALYSAINLYFDDLHCAFGGFSKNTDLDVFKEAISGVMQGAYRSRFLNLQQELSLKRSQYYPDGYIPYEEIGDTAYITFDEFTYDPTADHSVLPTDEDLPYLGNDTIRLVQYAMSKITRKKSPIKKVVLDLSNNGGGAVCTANYLLSAFLGNSSIALKDMTTGAQSTINYRADTNLDGVFDEKDTLAGRDIELYCLISGLSYSCANMVPCVFKDSGKVTLIGRTTGGGSCCVQPMCTASGTILQISGPYRFSFSKNGGFYDCDRGADPDVFINDMSKLYDRKYINKVINELK